MNKLLEHLNESYDKNITPAKKYSASKLKNLKIEITSKYQGSLFNLMKEGKLNGWCWQTTESVILFLNDDDYIERGNLYLREDGSDYYHSWVCFKYEDKEYVFDPCLNILCIKDDYTKAFNADVKGKVTSKEVKEELISQIKEPKKRTSEFFDLFLKSTVGVDNYNKIKERTKNEVVVHGLEDVNTPFYRNGAGYTTEFKDDKIKKLTVHYYENA